MNIKKVLSSLAITCLSVIAVFVITARVRDSKPAESDTAWISDFTETTDYGTLEVAGKENITESEPVSESVLTAGLENNTEIEAETISEQEPAAERIDIMVESFFGSEVVLIDGDDTTGKSFRPNAELNITADHDFSMLYIKWNKPVSGWTLKIGEETAEYGKSGFIHELVRLPSPATEATLILPDEYTNIADITAYSSGSLPDGVQDWNEPLDEADMLVLPTHSDDEYVFFGGVIPLYVDKGYRVQVAYLVDHRQHERLDSLWEAGIRNYPVVSDKVDVYCSTYADAAGYYGLKDTTSYIVDLIRRFKPEVIVAHDINGDSGHFAHILYVNSLLDAIEISGDPAQYPDSAEKYGVWDVPKTYLHSYSEGTVTLDYETPLEAFNGRTAFEVAEDSFKRCTSQYELGKYEVYGSDSQYDSHLFGCIRSSVGSDTACNDLFENIPEDYRSGINRSS